MFEFYEDFLNWLQKAYDYFWELITDFPEWLFEQVALQIVAFFQALPVPSFMVTAGNAFQGIPSSVLFFLGAFHVGPGVTMILGAYLLRFILRRIPIIG